MYSFLVSYAIHYSIHSLLGTVSHVLSSISYKYRNTRDSLVIFIIASLSPHLVLSCATRGCRGFNRVESNESSVKGIVQREALGPFSERGRCASIDAGEVGWERVQGLEAPTSVVRKYL